MNKLINFISNYKNELYLTLIIYLMALYSEPETKHFKIHEFHSKDGVKVPRQFYPNIWRLMTNLEVIRKELGNKKIYINSGYRTKNHNNNVGGVPNSQHLIGKAADIVHEHISPNEVFIKIIDLMQSGKITKGAVILYDTFVHYDIRGKMQIINTKI